jgi:hypothetical protein
MEHDTMERRDKMKEILDMLAVAVIAILMFLMG